MSGLVSIAGGRRAFILAAPTQQAQPQTLQLAASVSGPQSARHRRWPWPSGILRLRLSCPGSPTTFFSNTTLAAVHFIGNRGRTCRQTCVSEGPAQCHLLRCQVSQQLASRSGLARSNLLQRSCTMNAKRIQKSSDETRHLVGLWHGVDMHGQTEVQQVLLAGS